jgi:hypothetical protein
VCEASYDDCGWEKLCGIWEDAKILCLGCAWRDWGKLWNTGVSLRQGFEHVSSGLHSYSLPLCLLSVCEEIKTATVRISHNSLSDSTTRRFSTATHEDRGWSRPWVRSIQLSVSRCSHRSASNTPQRLSTKAFFQLSVSRCRPFNTLYPITEHDIELRPSTSDNLFPWLSFYSLYSISFFIFIETNIKQVSPPKTYMHFLSFLSQ